MTRIVIGVLGAILGKDGRFLLTKRDAPGISALHEKWQFVGGGMEYGESPEETLKREFLEELNVVPTILFPHPLVISKVWTKEEDKELADTQVVLLVYVVSIGNQEPTLDKDPDRETLEWKWFTVQEIMRLDTLPGTLETIEQAVKVISDLGLS